jgi:hypothetical protein
MTAATEPVSPKGELGWGGRGGTDGGIDSRLQYRSVDQFLKSIRFLSEVA